MLSDDNQSKPPLTSKKDSPECPRLRPNASYDAGSEAEHAVLSSFCGYNGSVGLPPDVEGDRMFRNIFERVTGMVRTLRQRFQKSSAPVKVKHLTTAKRKKPTKRKQSPRRMVKKA